MLWQQDVGGVIDRCQALDLNGGGASDFVCGRSKLGRFGYVDLKLVGSARLRAGRQNQLVATCTVVTQTQRENLGNMRKDSDIVRFDNVEILVLDASLRVVAQRRAFEHLTQASRWEVKLVDTTGDGLDEILSLSDRVQILKLK